MVVFSKIERQAAHWLEIAGYTADLAAELVYQDKFWEDNGRPYVRHGIPELTGVLNGWTRTGMWPVRPPSSLRLALAISRRAER